MATVLIISDDANICQSLKQTVTRFGYLCDSVQSDQDIFKVLSRTRYDLLCCNTHLKASSGFEFIKSILSHHSTIIAIMVANQFHPDLAENLFASGGFDYISVPIDSQRVQVTLKNALNRKQDQDRLIALRAEPFEDRGQGEQKAQQMTGELNSCQDQIINSEKMASIGQLTAGVAHEINNPVGFVASNLNTLKHYQKSLMALMIQYRRLLEDICPVQNESTAGAAVLNRIAKIKRLQLFFDVDYLFQDTRVLIRESVAGISRVKKIVRDLKTFAHPGQDQAKFADLHELLDATLNLVWHKLKYNITVCKEYGKLPPVKCWSSQINQVFLNIIVNAIQAISKKGTITITTDILDHEWAEICISDTGKGIADEHLARIFDPFFTTKAVGIGTGLGLHMSDSIIKKHRGTISVKSKIGHGTTFKIRLPISSDRVNDISQP